jgi:hypothetical protein
MIASRLKMLAVAGLVIASSSVPSSAQKVANQVAVFSGLDKITGRIITFDVYIEETVQFGALRVTPKVCYNRPPTEAAQTDAFVQVDEITLDNKIQRIFTGWMFAASPGLNAVEHPVFDVWLNDCRMESDVPPPNERNGEAREAKANQETEPGAEGGVLGVEMIDGIPIPRRKPAIPLSIDSSNPNAPTEEVPGAEGEILD